MASQSESGRLRVQYNKNGRMEEIIKATTNGNYPPTDTNLKIFHLDWFEPASMVGIFSTIITLAYHGCKKP